MIPYLLAPLVAAACSSLFGLDQTPLSISFTVREGFGSALRLEVEVDGSVFRLDGPGTRSVQVSEGDRRVVVRLLATGDTLAADAFAQPFRNDSDHWVHAWVGDGRPLTFCSGEIRPHPLGGADTLFVLRGSLPRDAVC